MAVHNVMGMKDRFDAHEWLASHPNELQKHAGEWVAVTGKGIVASGKSLADIHAFLASKKMTALLHYQPERVDVLYALSPQ